MKPKPHRRTKRNTTKSVLRLPDLEHAKTAVLNSLTSPDAQRGYRHAIDEFVDWYCSEPRLAFNRIVVLRNALISNRVNSHREQSICVLAPCADSRTKPPTAVFLAPIWRVAFAALKG
jgi:hypothetical protein